MNESLEIHDVALRYSKGNSIFSPRSHWALRGVSFCVKKGESVAIMGRNGCGKSTLLRVLAGVLRPDRGWLRNGLGRTSLLTLQLGFVQYLTGRENAIMGAMLNGYTRKQALLKIDVIKDFSGLEDAFEDPIATYSDGMASRLGFSVALFMEPDVLLIDETLAVGDDDFKQKSGAAMAERLRSDLTVVLVTHSVTQARSLCDRVIWIENGKVKLDGTAKEVTDAYIETQTHYGSKT